MNFQVVQNFASFLDNTQYKEAGECLSDNCKYQYSEGKYEDRDNITSLYKKLDSLNRRQFDELSYSSHVEQIGENEFKIHYTDKLRKGPLWHEHRFYEVVKVENDLIVDIRNHSIPGESESMREFYTRATRLATL
jgi:hypothetical protein